MDQVNHWLEAIFRWIHVLAGVLWIGHLYFFNFVNAQFAKTLDDTTRPKVVPELMPRALYFFRWGAAYTWITGVLLLGLVYYMGGSVARDAAQHGLNSGVGFLAVLIAFPIYDQLWKSPLGKNEQAAVGVSFLLVAAAAAGLHYGLNMHARGLFIHVGAMFGTIMAANVWMRIWPMQQRIIGAIKAGQKPDAAWPAMAGLRSKHNTYLSVPLLYTMISSHHTGALHVGGDQFGWAVLLAFVAVGWAGTYWIYQQSAKPSVTQI